MLKRCKLIKQFHINWTHEIYVETKRKTHKNMTSLEFSVVKIRYKHKNSSETGLPFDTF